MDRLKLGVDDGCLNEDGNIASVRKSQQVPQVVFDGLGRRGNVLRPARRVVGSTDPVLHGTDAPSIPRLVGVIGHEDPVS